MNGLEADAVEKLVVMSTDVLVVMSPPHKEGMMGTRSLMHMGSDVE